MNHLQEQFTKIFGGGFNMTPRELGAHLCAIGEPHNEKWCDEITAGYNEQYAKEQQNTHGSNVNEAV